MTHLTKAAAVCFLLLQLIWNHVAPSSPSLMAVSKTDMCQNRICPPNLRYVKVDGVYHAQCTGGKQPTFTGYSLRCPAYNNEQDHVEKCSRKGLLTCFDSQKKFTYCAEDKSHCKKNEYVIRNEPKCNKGRNLHLGTCTKTQPACQLNEIRGKDGLCRTNKNYCKISPLVNSCDLDCVDGEIMFNGKPIDMSTLSEDGTSPEINAWCMEKQLEVSAGCPANMICTGHGHNAPMPDYALSPDGKGSEKITVLDEAPQGPCDNVADAEKLECEEFFANSFGEN